MSESLSFLAGIARDMITMTLHFEFYINTTFPECNAKNMLATPFLNWITSLRFTNIAIWHPI